VGRSVTTFEMSRVRTVVQGPGGRHGLSEGIRNLSVGRAMVITGRSLGSEPMFDALVADLGETCVGTFRGVQAHNPVEVLVELIAMSRDVEADVFVGVGGGSPIDAAKFAALGVLEGITDPKTLAEYAVQFEYPDTELVRPLSGTPAPVIAIPTTLSAAEWDGFAGSVDHERGVKDVSRYLELTPALVILDPELAARTPRDLWAQTGARALDHAIETLYARNAHPFTSSLCIGALELLGRYLERSVDDASDLEAAQQCQSAAWMSILGVHNVSLGLSHAIGHQLGALGVPHGATSCVMLPHVMRFLEPATSAEQRRIAVALDPASAARGVSAADIVAALLERLEVPRRVSEFGVPRDRMTSVADATLGDVVARESPVPVDREMILGLLEAAW
jgi:alcohol dehydrogenase class IV